MDKEKILVVDDNPKNIQLIADSLKDLDASIVFATSGKKAIEIEKEMPLSLILMDINMPEMDGFETVKNFSGDAPIIFVTAHEDKENILRAFREGGVDYITKPFHPEELIARAKTHLRLYKLNRDLQEEVQKEITAREEKEKILLHQSKLAAMGEMIDAVGHQWKQPLNMISLIIGMIDMDFHDGRVDSAYIEKFIDRVYKQIEHMTITLDEFRSFFRPNTTTKTFSIKKMIDKVLFLVKDDFQKNVIKFEVKGSDAYELIGVENEFKHLILNIINNAKDAFIENEIKGRKILIEVSQDKKSKKIEISDNAGGIPEDIIDDIFKVNVTSKDEGKGTGVGLYLSSQIAKKYRGELRVENIDSGAKFIFEQKRENEQ